MTTPNCSVATIPARLYSALLLALCAALLAAAPAASPQSRAASKAAAKSAAKPAPKPPPAPPASLAALVRAWRESPNPGRRAAVAAWGVSHPRELPAVELALGVGEYEQRDYASAIAALHKAQPALPQIADYTAYYLAAARLESRDFSGVAQLLAAVRESSIPSPLAARAWVLEARSLATSAPADAVRLLQEHAAGLPQPDGDMVLGEAQQAAGDLAGSVETWRRVYCQYVTGDGAVRSATALAGLRAAMGPAYPELSARQILRHAGRLMEAREFALARTEYRAIEEHSTGANAIPRAFVWAPSITRRASRPPRLPICARSKWPLRRPMPNASTTWWNAPAAWTTTPNCSTR